MNRAIVLKFNGELKKYGFQVVVEVTNSGNREIRAQGYLPPCPILEDKYQKWQLSLQALAKIKNPHSQASRSRNVTIFDKIQSLRESRENAKYSYRDAEKSLVETMNSWLRSESFMGIRDILDNQISDSGKGRLIIRTSDLELKKLPWESWEWLDFGNRQVTVSYSSINFVSPPHTPQKLIRIIAVIGQASNLNVQQDLQFLRESLPANTILESLVSQSRQQLLDYLNNHDCDIFYFAGHSKTEGDRSKIWINETEYLEIDDLKNTLKKMRLNRLKLAIFNSCDGLGLANDLDEENISIPNLIVMRDAIHDRVAQKFLQELVVKFIIEKLPLHQAVEKARSSLESLEDDFPGSSLQPILISGSTQDQTYQSWLQKTIPQTQIFQLLFNSLIVSLLISGLKAFGWLELLEWKSYDLLLKFKTTEQLDSRLLIVDVTQEDINKLEGEYPLSDRTLLKGLQNLNKYKPNLIGIDIYRYPPFKKNSQLLNEHQQLIKYWEDNSNVVSICDHSSVEPSERNLSLNVNNIGFVDVPLDTDEVIRRILITVEPPAKSACKATYSLSSYLALTYLQSKGYRVKLTNNDILEISDRNGSKRVRWKALQPHSSFYSKQETTSGYQILLNYRRTASVSEISQRVSLTEVLAGKVPPEKIRDRIVLIGVTDPNLAKDEFKTPYDEEIRGLWLHAHAVSQLVSSVEDGRILLEFLNWEVQILLIWLLSLTTAFVTWQFKYLISIKITGILIVLIYTISLGAFLSQGLIIPIVPATLAVIISLLAGLISTITSLERESSQADTL